MIYITTTDLAERPGARELAQVASAAHKPVVADDLMDATLRGTSRAGFDVDDIAAADEALARITDAVSEAESLIDGFLQKRGYGLPLNPVPKLVTGWARDITRYFLHKDRISDDSRDPIARGYRDAMKLLKDIAAGTFSLGAADPVVNDNNMDVRFDMDTKVFGRNELSRFR